MGVPYPAKQPSIWLSGSGLPGTRSEFGTTGRAADGLLKGIGLLGVGFDEFAFVEGGAPTSVGTNMRVNEMLEQGA